MFEVLTGDIFIQERGVGANLTGSFGDGSISITVDASQTDGITIGLSVSQSIDEYNEITDTYSSSVDKLLLLCALVPEAGLDPLDSFT